MNILAQLEDAKTQYAAANELFEKATAELTQAKADLAAKDAQLAESVAKYQESEEASHARVETWKAELQAAAAKIAELEANAKTAEEKAIELVAKQGIAPVKVETGVAGSDMTKAQAIAAYDALTDSYAKGQFYAKHKALLLS